MKTSTAIAAAILAVGFGAQAGAGDWSRLAAAAGLSPEEARGMSLTEIHAHKINRESPGDAEVSVSSRSYRAFVGGNAQLVAVAGIEPGEARGMTLTEIAARKANLGTRGDERIPLVAPAAGGFDATAHPQLLAAAGIEAGEAVGMSLTEVSILKFNREQDGDDR